MKKLEGVMKKGDAVMLSIAETKVHIAEMARWRGIVEGVDEYKHVLVNWENGKIFSAWPEWLEKMVG